MILLLLGENTFSIDKKISEIINDLNNEADIINFSQDSIETLPNELITDSFFSKNRVFIINNRLEKIDSNIEKKLIDSLSHISDSTIVIFTETKTPKGKIAKFLKEKAETFKFEKPKGKDVVDFVKKTVNSEGGEISPLAAERLVSYIGSDYWQLAEEIKKLSLYKVGDANDSVIQTTDVDELIKSSFESSIFDLMDAISTKNVKRAQILMNSFLDSGENAIYILTMIARQFRNIAMAKFEPNISEGLLAKKAGIHPFVAKKSISQARNFESSEIIKIYDRISEADYKLKSGFVGSHVLEEFVLDI